MQTLTYTIGKDRRALVKDIQNFTIDFNDQGVKNWVQARQYERSMRQVFVNVNNDDDNPFNLTGCNVWFEGVLPDKTHKILDAKHAVILDAQNGQFRFDMPAQAFAVAGSYVQAFFRIVRDGKSITTLEFDLEVLADKVISGLVPRDYITPFEDLYDQLQQIVDGADSKLQDKLNEWNKKLQDLFDSLNKMGVDIQTLLQTLQNRIADLETKIKQDGLFTQAEAEDFKKSIVALMKQHAKIYTNVQDMINDATVSDGGYAQTLGYYTAGDGGGAMYRFSKSPSDFSIEVSNALNAVPEIAKQIVNVRQFGIKGDGKTDCSEIVNKLAKNYGLYFPAGTYLVSKQLDIYNGIYGQSGTAEQSEYTKAPISSATTFVSSIASTKDTAVIVNHGEAATFKQFNIKLNSNESGLIDAGTYTTQINDVLITNLKEAYGVKIDRQGSRASSIHGLVVEADLTVNAESVGLYYLTGTDQLLDSYWAMGCHTGIHAVACLFYGTNIHLWCGHDKDKITKEWWEGTNAIYLQSSKAYLTNVYSDTAKLFIGTNGKSYASVKNLVSLFDDTLSAFETEISDARIFGESGNDSLHIDGGLIYGSGVSQPLFAFDRQLCSVTNATVIVPKVPTPEDYVAVYYREYLPTTGIGYTPHYTVNYKNQKGNYVEVARMHADGNNGGIAEVRINDNTNLATKLEVTISDGHFKREDLRGSFDLQVRYLNDWIIIYAKARVNDYNVNVDILGNTAATSFVNYSFIRVDGDTEFPRFIQTDTTNLVPISTSSDW